MVNRARIGEAWEALDLNVVRHLEIQFELLPGQEHPEDLFQLLRRKYAVPEQEEILIAGFRLLTFMPVMRIRADELIDFVHEKGKRYRSFTSWKALIELIESHITGLEDLVLTRESLNRKDRRRLRVMNRTLAIDKKLRNSLYKISVDSELKLSNSSENEDAIRQAAWRALLRSLPANRIELFQEGLLQHEGRFLLATLEEAAKLHQRMLWNQLLSHWERLFTQNLPEDEKSKRLKAVASYFEATRNYDAIRYDGQEISPFLKFALDHEDADVRDVFLKAIVNAGYRLEIDKEIQRRDILNIRKNLTQSNNRVIENELARLRGETVERQKEKADCVFEIQDGLRERDKMITEGWIHNSQFQVSMEEVREVLTETLDQASHEYAALDELQCRMRFELENSRKVRDHVQSLVNQHRMHAKERDRIQDELNSEQQNFLHTELELNDIFNEIKCLKLNFPSAPKMTGDPEVDQRAADRHTQEVGKIQSEIRRLQDRSNDLEGTAYRLRGVIKHCEQGISREETAMEKLQREIDITRKEIKRLKYNINAIRSDFCAGQQRWKAMRREIEILREEKDRIAHEFAAARQHAKEELSQNTSQIEIYQQELTQKQIEIHRLSNLLNQTGRHKDNQTTKSQELIQALDSGRHHHDDIAKKAIVESANANDIGYSLEARENQNIMQQQESRVHYAYGTSEALSRQDKPPTRKEHKKQKRQAVRRRRLPF
jgi:chromosome segregation ATPase